jgi:hypothetical protein
MTSTFWAVLLEIALVSPGIRWDAVPAASDPSQHPTQTLSVERALGGVYLPRADRDEGCIPERRGFIVLPPLAVGMTHISQSADFVIIRNQQISRVVPLRPTRHIMRGFKSYLGSPQGWWEGDTLVIESTGLRSETVAAVAAISAEVIDVTSARIVERLTLLDTSTLRYEFTFEASYVQPFNIQLQLARLPAAAASRTSDMATCIGISSSDGPHE